MSQAKRRKPSLKAETAVTLKLSASELAELDAWIATLPEPRPERADAIWQGMRALFHVIAENRAEQLRDARRRLDLDLGSLLRAPRQ